jgi:hypothetical protein
MFDNSTRQRVCVVGGGIFGISTAIVLAEQGMQVTLIERQKDLMTESSLVNQNRIHFGYHYPRSLETGRESLHGYESFKQYYSKALVEGFKKYYAIAKDGSLSTPEEFLHFCDQLGLVYEESYPDPHLLRPDSVSACWLVNEIIFDYHTLRQTAILKLMRFENVTVLRNTHPVSINDSGTLVTIKLVTGEVIEADYMVNATYSGLRGISELVGGEPISTKSELCMMPILRAPFAIAPIGITVMDGPFCSLMPRGFVPNEFILYHVTHSVLETQWNEAHTHWSSIQGFPELELQDASTFFFPVVKEFQYLESWITTRVVLPHTEQSDARPTLLYKHTPRTMSIFSGKLTTCVESAKRVLETINAEESVLS